MDLSIITPTLHSAEYLRECLSSLTSQSKNHIKFEHIVIDGGSQDNTANIVSEFSQIQFLIKPGLTAAEAVNHGFSVALGRYLLWLNSDDFLENDALQKFESALLAEPNCDVYLGGLSFVDKLSCPISDFSWFEIMRFDSSPLDKILYGRPLVGSSFIKRSRFADVGGIDESYPFSNDRKFMTKLMINGATFHNLDANTLKFRIHDGSKTTRNDKKNVSRYLSEHIDWSSKLARDCTSCCQTKKRLLCWGQYETFRLLFYSILFREFGQLRELSKRLTKDIHCLYALWMCVRVGLYKTIACCKPKRVRH